MVHFPFKVKTWALQHVFNTVQVVHMFAECFDKEIWQNVICKTTLHKCETKLVAFDAIFRPKLKLPAEYVEDMCKKKCSKYSSGIFEIIRVTLY